MKNMKAKTVKALMGGSEILIVRDIMVGRYVYLMMVFRLAGSDFIAFPGLGVVTEIEIYTNDVTYNINKLMKAGLKRKSATAIAEYLWSWVADTMDYDYVIPEPSDLLEDFL
jgi:alpha-galactosidase